MGIRWDCALRAWWSARRKDMWTRRMGVDVKVASAMARCVASASAICGREVAWNWGRVWPREMSRLVILGDIVRIGSDWMVIVPVRR